jgi:hypothetical protein
MMALWCTVTVYWPLYSPPSTGIEDRLVSSIPQQKLPLSIAVLCSGSKLLFNDGQCLLYPIVSQWAIAPLSNGVQEYKEEREDEGEAFPFEVYGRNGDLRGDLARPV